MTKLPVTTVKKITCHTKRDCCYEFDEALKDLYLWPAGKREIEMKSFAHALAQEYPEFAAKLREILKKSE
jgi:hypothetical protein